MQTGIRARVGAALALTAFVLILTAKAAPERRPDYRPAAYAITKAKIVAGPKQTYDPGTVIVRDGLIEAVGPADKVTVPYDAEVIDGKGLVVYAGFIDLYTTVGADTAAKKTDAGRPVPYSDFAFPRTPPDNRNGLTPEFRVSDVLDLPDATAEPRRRLGFTSLVSAPGGTIASGQSALVGLGGLPRREAVLASPVALHIALRASGFGGGDDGDGHNHDGAGFDLDHELIHRLEAMAQVPADPPATPGQGRRQAPTQTQTPATPTPSTPATPGQPTPGTPTPGGGRRGQFGQGGAADASGGYPRSLMGMVAHLRQAMLDAEHHHAWTERAKTQGGAVPPFDPTLDALYAARTKTLPVWWEANSRDEIHRALDLAEEFGTSVVIVGGQDAWQVVDRLKATRTPVILRLDFAEEPRVPTETEYRKRAAEERDDALAVLKDRRARWKERVAGVKILVEAGVPVAFSSDGLSRTDTFHTQVRKLIDAGLSREAAIKALTVGAAEIVGASNRIGTIEPGKLGHLVAWSGAYGETSARPKYVLIDGQKIEIRPSEGGDRAEGFRARFGGGGGFPGMGTMGDMDAPAGPSGRRSETAQTKSSQGAPEKQETEKIKAAKDETKAAPDEPKEKSKDEPAKSQEKAKSEPAKAQEKSDKPAAPADAPKAATETNPTPAQKESQGRTQDDQPPASFEDVSTEFDEGRKPTIQTGGDVLVKGVTILTVTQGTIPKGSILVKGGKIAAVGTDIKAPEGVTVIEADGLVALPGIIDTHSHMAISGGVNEMSLSIVPEVRVKDVVRGDDPTIHYALAGGTTLARLLHGSANTIGGQDAVIKLRYGQAGRDLILKDAPQGVKFALGENVTRRTGRFPNTRMGVEATIERAFDEAKAYKAAWQTHGAAKARGEASPAPRRDLRLEALVGILDGSIKIHSHCYRSDEILMLMRVAERYGVRVQSLQHVLEGYKVAAEIAAHGASASTFADWWAYKVEAYDAIPFNAALLLEAGAAVCIKSDSDELVRHLNLETAKMVRYGGVSEEQALAMVTINPARQLGLEGRLGSIEVGKDADFALYTAHPLDAFSQVLMTFVDGEVYFQRKGRDGKPVPLKARPGDHTAMPSTLDKARPSAGPLDVAVSEKGVYALTGATLHPVSGSAIENGTLVVADGKITALGGPDTSIPSSAQTVDCRGLHVWPGLIDAGNITGLFEIGSLAETQDASDSAPMQPELRTSVALHPDSELIPVTRAAGILSTYVQPTGGTIAGRGCLVDLDGWVPREMVLADAVALNVNLPRSSNLSPEVLARIQGLPGLAGGTDFNRQRRDRLDAVKEMFRLALAYDKVVSEAKAKGMPAPTPDPRLAALVPFAKGEKPIIFNADRRGQILDALKLASELKVKAIISGGVDAWKVASELKAAKVPVIIAGTLRSPVERTDPADAPYANPAKLFAAGVPFAFRACDSADRGTAGRNLPFEAATAVAFGLPEEEAVKALTLNPAQFLGVADRIGSLEVGKRANLVVTAGHVLQPTSEIKTLFIGGKPVPPESRHTRLYGKYRQRLAEVKAGKAPLGLDRGPAVAGPAPVASPTPAGDASTPVGGQDASQR